MDLLQSNINNTQILNSQHLDDMKKIIPLIVLMLVACCFVSCDKESNTELPDANANKINPEIENLSSIFFNTSWMHSKTVNGDNITNSNGHKFTFTNDVFGTDCYWYTFDGIAHAGPWVVTSEGMEIGSPQNTGSYLTSMQMGALIGTCCVYHAEIVKFTQTELILKEGNRYLYFTSVRNSSNGNNSSSDEDDINHGTITCTWCKGSGKCHACGGDGLWLGNSEICDYCNGNGICEHCHGTGKIQY